MGDGTLGMWPDDEGAGEHEREREEEELANLIATMEQRYRLAKKAPVGATIHCPYCNAYIIKNTYQRKFCKGKGKKCKDSYWNLVDDKRRDRSHRFSKH